MRCSLYDSCMRPVQFNANDSIVCMFLDLLPDLRNLGLIRSGFNVVS